MSQNFPINLNIAKKLATPLLNKQRLKIDKCYNKLLVKTWIQFSFPIKQFDENLGTSIVMNGATIVVL